MTFIETPRFPVDIRFGVAGGPEYSTTIVMTSAGWESRNINWSEARGKWTADYGPHDRATTETLLAFFRAVRGAAHGFRFQDYSDYEATTATGLLGAGIGTGTPTYQLYKRYTAGALTDIRPIRKPVSGDVVIHRGAGVVTFGAAAGNCAVDTTTGIVTFVADGNSAASAITPGATTQVTLAANLGLSGGKLLYLAGFTGTDAALVNGIAHTINSISGGGPYVFTLATNTNGKSLAVGAGKGYAYPQVSDALTWAGQFDVPVRFETDAIKIEAVDRNVFSWSGVALIELRT